MKTGTLTLTGKSGVVFPFETFPLGQAFKPLGSIYCVTKALGDGKHRILYVGQTKDLSQRFVDHHKEDAWKQQGATHISVRLEKNELSRLVIETDLIRSYNPCCNG